MGKGVGYKIYSRKCNPRDYKMDKHEERVHLRFLRLEAFLKGCFFFRSFIIIYFATMVLIVHRKGPCPMSFCFCMTIAPLSLAQWKEFGVLAMLDATKQLPI